jgi:hypothetical protein
MCPGRSVFAKVQIRTPQLRTTLRNFGTMAVKQSAKPVTRSTTVDQNQEKFMRDILARSFSSKVSYPDTETGKNVCYDDYVKSLDNETGSTGSTTAIMSDTKKGRTTKNAKMETEVKSRRRDLSEYDLEKAKSPDPDSFQSIENKLKFELEKCFGNISPNHSGLSTRYKLEQKLSDELFSSTDVETSSSEDFNTAPSSPKQIKMKLTPKKKAVSDYTYLSSRESIDIINRREYNLISIDNEFYERATKFVTEIGISIYNPKYQQFSLFPHILNIHFIVIEHINKRNGYFVPDSKMNNITGQSILISEKHISQAINLIFDCLGPKTCIVGHNVSGDISSFKNVGLKLPTTYGVIDTSELWYGLVGTKNVKSSLGFILDILSIPSAFLHNGVNDAYYTLVACLMLSSPELRNNLVFKKFIKEQPAELEQIPETVDAVKIEAQMPDFSMFTPEQQEIKKKRWLRKMEKTKKKSKSALKKGDTTKGAFETMKIRCSLDEDAIIKKHTALYGSKKMNPAPNKFYKPRSYEVGELCDLLKELNV